MVQFLEGEIYGKKGYEAFLTDQRNLDTKLMDIGTFKEAAMKALAKNVNIFREWREYGEMRSDLDIKNLEKKCQESYEIMKQESIYFNRLPEEKQLE